MYRGLIFQMFLCLFLCLFLWGGPLCAAELIISIPKTRTNVLIKCIQLIKKKELNDFLFMDHFDPNYIDQLYWSHGWNDFLDGAYSLFPSKAKMNLCRSNNIKVLVTRRDPRELVCAVSRAYNICMAEAIKAVGKHFFTKVRNKDGALRFNTYSDLYRDIMLWAEYENTYFTSYEKLVGSRGGGSDVVQLEEIKSIANFIGVDLSHEEAIRVGKDLYGGTHTFRKGKIDTWKTKMTQDELELFYEREGSLVEDLGYKR